MQPLRVRFLTGPRRGQDAVFRHSPVRAGRSRDNDVPIPDQTTPLASGHHAEFRFEQGQWWVVDLDSTNGTSVNGVPVGRAKLADRDRVTLGDYELEVHTAAAGSVRRAATIIAAGILIAVAMWAWWTTARSPFDDIPAAAGRSVYLLVIQDGDRRTPVGTAFAIDRAGRLATNAHVAAPLRGLLQAGPGVPLAISANASERPRHVTGVTLHPGWQAGSVSNDVAVVTVDGPPLTPLPLAASEQVTMLRPGATVAIFGFLSASTELDPPAGTLTVSVLREVRGSRYLVVGVTVAPGASGSPVFTDDGAIIGMIAGSGREGGRGQQGGEAAGQGIAVSVSVLHEVLARRH